MLKKLVSFIVFFGAFVLVVAPNNYASALTPTIPPDSVNLIKGSGAGVYLKYNNGRYVFPNDKTYFSWWGVFRATKITDSELAAIPLRGVVTYRPGAKMVKIDTAPNVYAVAPGGLLRWVKTEQVAVDLYGPNWNTMIDDMPDAFFTNYKIGTEINSAADFSLSENLSWSIDDNTKEQNILRGKLSYNPIVTPVTPAPVVPTSTPVVVPVPITNTTSTIPAPTSSDLVAGGLRFTSDTPSGLVSHDADQVVAKLVLSVDSNAGGYPFILKAINFQISSNGVTLSDSRTLSVRQTSRTGTRLGYYTIDPSAGGTFNQKTAMADIDFTDVSILPGETLILYVTLDTTDVGNDDTISITVAGDGVIWSDGVSTINSLDGLPLEAKTLYY